MQPKNFTKLLVVLTVFLYVMTGFPAGTPTAMAEPKRPKWKFERVQEDWSVMKDIPASQRTDIFDSIKYIPLNDDGSIWLSTGGHMRGRAENWNNFVFGAPANDDATYFTWRTKLHTDFHFKENFRVFLEGKSALTTNRSLPGGRRANLDVDTIELQQAFFDLKAPLGGGSSITLRAGRQEFLMGKQRLISPLPWGNVLRHWDGVTGILKASGWDIRGFWSQFVPVRKFSFNKSTASNTLFGIYGTSKILNKTFQLDLYWLGIDRDGRTFNGTSGNESRHTIGGLLGGKIPNTNFDFEMEGAHQFGGIGDANIQAYMFSSFIGYTVPALYGKPRIYVGYDYASGDDEVGGDVQTFNQLFPLGHAYLGFIDIIGRQNIIDFSQGMSFKPFQASSVNMLKKLIFKVDNHLFFRASKADALYNAGGGVVRAGSLGNSKEIGTEVDLTAKFPVGRHLGVLVGYSHFFSGDFVEESGAGLDIDFLYAQLNYMF